ncbi:cell division protein ZapA [bacterium]|jgi:cell division protein ZapA (FtsZ GTPase activity inhibitor)|nr:cell division protein ZapA [bacterium]
MSSPEKITVLMLEKEYKFVTDENHELLEEAAKIVDTTIGQLTDSSRNGPVPIDTVLVGALQIAADLVKERVESMKIKSRVESLSNVLNV